MTTVSDKSTINDMRLFGDFKGVAFSGYKISDAKKQFLQNMYNGKIEQACYWCAELICAGHFMEIWEIFLHYLGKHIHLGNPKMPIYLNKRFQVFKTIMVQGMYYDEIQLRNNETIRSMFAEIICIFATSSKKNSIEIVKINREEEFDMSLISEKLKAPSNDYGATLLRKEDPRELAIAINEFAYHISSKDHLPNMVQACYWIEWILEFDVLCKKRKNPCKLDRRHYVPAEFKFQNDIVWIVWDAIMEEVKQRDDALLKQIVDALLELFCIKYTTASAKKRRHLMYFAVSLLTEPYQTNVELVSNKGVIQATLAQLEMIYKQIKKNEVGPKTDYLFSGLSDNSNYQKSLQRMEMMNSMDFV